MAGLIDMTNLIKIFVSLTVLFFLSACGDRWSHSDAVRDFNSFSAMLSGLRGPATHNVEGVTVGEVVAQDKRGLLAVDSDGDGKITSSDSLFLAGRYQLVDIDSYTYINKSDSFVAVFSNFDSSACASILTSLFPYIDAVDVVPGTDVSATINVDIKKSANVASGVKFVDEKTIALIKESCANDVNSIVVAKRLSRF